MKVIKNISKKKRVVMLIIFLLLSIGILFALKKSSDNVRIEHRLQWWLGNIGWETNRSEQDGQGIKIAVLDTGVDVSHVDLGNNIQDNLRISLLERSEEGEMSHGTAIAGIIGAYPSHEKGVLGVAPGATIIPIDITDEDTVEVQNIVEGIRLAVELDVDIISISLGLKDDNEDLHKSIKEAYNEGIVIIAAAGNYMTNDILYPAKYDEVIAVGAVDKQGEIISPVGELEKSVVYLPGESVVTTICEDDGYIGVDGTSFSSAMLSGIVAVIMEKASETNQEQIYDYFQKHTEKIKVEECIEYFKGGM